MSVTSFNGLLRTRQPPGLPQGAKRIQGFALGGSPGAFAPAGFLHPRPLPPSPCLILGLYPQGLLPISSLPTLDPHGLHHREGYATSGTCTPWEKSRAFPQKLAHNPVLLTWFHWLCPGFLSCALPTLSFIIRGMTSIDLGTPGIRDFHGIVTIITLVHIVGTTTFDRILATVTL
jgi:hypothetical protein